MKLQNQLSIKSALRFALPCLAASLLFTACSNEDVETTPEYNGSVNPTVRFSASAPLSSEVASTRIGINDATKPNVGSYDQPEPVIWIADDEVLVVFVPVGSGNRVYAKFKVDGAKISEDGTSAELVSVDIPTTLNGDYTVYALTPYTTQTTNQLTFDLSSQTQSVGHTDYNHLGKSTIMRAPGIPATFTNGATSSVVNFEFEYLTSFLRFHITNDLDESITVTGINLSHPDLISSDRFNYANNVFDNPVKSDLSLQFEGGQPLSSGAAFDSYFSAFPLSASAGILTLSVKYTDSDGAKVKAFTIPVEYLDGSHPYFKKGSRFLFDISLTAASSLDYIKYEGYYITKNGDITSSYQVEFEGNIYTRYSGPDDVQCPDGFDLLTYNRFRILGLSNKQSIQFFEAIGLLQGYKTETSSSMVRRYDYYLIDGTDIYINPSNENFNLDMRYYLTDGSGYTRQIYQWINNPIYMDLRCFKPIN